MELRDVVYYKRKKFMDVAEMYDIDSPDDFMRFVIAADQMYHPYHFERYQL